MRKTDVLVYTGGATSRTITKDEWLAAGVPDQGTITWDRTNRKRCRVGDLRDSAFSLLMENHANEFRIIDSGPRNAAAKES